MAKQVKQDPPTSDSPKSILIWGVLLAISCIAHFSIHLSTAKFSLVWIFSVACLLMSFALIQRPNLNRLLLLAGIQVLHFFAVAPFNPDHWILICLVNLTLLSAALRQWLLYRKVDPRQLMDDFSQGAKLIFLVCYSFAAISKYNIHFLFSDLSAARAMQKLQIGGFPALKYFVWIPAAPWLALICETALPICLCIRRLRNVGIIIALFFHAALMLSPTVKVYDFTLAVYAMLYLFTSNNFDTNLMMILGRLKSRLATINSRIWPGVLITAATTIIVTSFVSPLESVPKYYLVTRWQIALAITSAVIVTFLLAIATKSIVEKPAVRPRQNNFWPQWGLPYIFVSLSLLNGLCPYLGLKTQGSFTMFSNLQTEAGQWNHLFMPQAMRIFDSYQDKLVTVVASTEEFHQQQYIEKNLQATEFEIRRNFMHCSDLKMTVQENGQNVAVTVDSNSRLTQPLPWWKRKLMIFRPVSPNGQPFTSN